MPTARVAGDHAAEGQDHRPDPPDVLHLPPLQEAREPPADHRGGHEVDGHRPAPPRTGTNGVAVRQVQPSPEASGRQGLSGFVGFGLPVTAPLHRSYCTRQVRLRPSIRNVNSGLVLTVTSSVLIPKRLSALGSVFPRSANGVGAARTPPRTANGASAAFGLSGVSRAEPSPVVGSNRTL